MPLNLGFESSATFAAAPAAPRPWVWDGFLAPGMVTLLTSRWKAGKTTLLSVLLSKLGTGGTVAGGEVSPATAVVVTEEPADLWRERHGRLGFAPGVEFVCRPFHGRPTVSEWAELTGELAARRPGVVAFDPLAMFLPGAVENSPAAMLDALRPLNRLTDAGSAVVLVHHPAKRGGAAELSPRGTGALAGFADILVSLDRLPGAGGSDRVRVLKAESRLRGTVARTVELSADGRDYTVLAGTPEPGGFEAGWPVLQTMLLEADRRETRRDLLKHWPGDFERPSFNTLVRWLDRAVREKLLEVRGTGRNQDPFRYALPGRKFEFDHIQEPMFDVPGGPMSPARLKKALNEMKKMFG